MFLAGEPARIRQDAVTPPPRNNTLYPPITPPETPPNPPSLSSMATMSAAEIQYRFRDAPSPPPNRPLPPLPPPRVRSASPSTAAFPGAQVTNERLASRPKRSSTPTKRHTTPTPETTSTSIEPFEEEAIQEPALTPQEEFVNSIAETQLDAPTRPSLPRYRISSNSLKRISAPSVPFDPVTEKTPTEIAKRNRRTNIFQVFDQLDIEKAGLDDIHEEHIEERGTRRDAARKSKRQSRRSGGVWNGAPVSPLSQRSSMKSVRDLVWPEERQGNGPPVPWLRQRNSVKSVENMVWPEDSQVSRSPTPTRNLRHSMKSVRNLAPSKEKQENGSPTSRITPRNSMNSVENMNWPEQNSRNVSPTPRSSQRSSMKSVQDLSWPEERKRNSEKVEGLVRRSTGKVIDRDPMSSQAGSIFTSSQNSPLSIRNSVKTIEDLFRGERDSEFRKQLEEAGFVLDPEVEEEALDVMVSAATDHMEGVHFPGVSEGYNSESQQPAHTEASVPFETNDSPGEGTKTRVTEKGEEGSETTIEHMDCATNSAGAQTEPIKKPADTFPTDKVDKQHTTTDSATHNSEATDRDMVLKDPQADIITEIEDETQPRPSIHIDERQGGLEELPKDTVVLPSTVEQRDFAFGDISIRRKPVGSGISRPSSAGDSVTTSTPLEGAEKSSLYNLDSKFSSSRHNLGTANTS